MVIIMEKIQETLISRMLLILCMNTLLKNNSQRQKMLPKQSTWVNVEQMKIVTLKSSFYNFDLIKNKLKLCFV